MKRTIAVLILLLCFAATAGAQRSRALERNADKLARALYYIDTRYVDVST